ncbi:hypothetical protein RF11_04633 [Thelohanellus kitauei]|uniref:Uncharacterized protein n=1 Tax=Thelohanellus kitauei TaxID=669202 RepID=A0A0C2NK03_THEKT|nr:hypothetical protein RF11_04633 [Thelohanellus kitauei]
MKVGMLNSKWIMLDNKWIMLESKWIMLECKWVMLDSKWIMLENYTTNTTADLDYLLHFRNYYAIIDSTEALGCSHFSLLPLRHRSTSAVLEGLIELKKYETSLAARESPTSLISWELVSSYILEFMMKLFGNGAINSQTIHDQALTRDIANFYIMKILNCNINTIWLENIKNTLEVDYHTSQDQQIQSALREVPFPHYALNEREIFIPSYSRDSVESENGALYGPWSYMIVTLRHTLRRRWSGTASWFIIIAYETNLIFESTGALLAIQ